MNECKPLAHLLQDELRVDAVATQDAHTHSHTLRGYSGATHELLKSSQKLLKSSSRATSTQELRVSNFISKPISCDAADEGDDGVQQGGAERAGPDARHFMEHTPHIPLDAIPLSRDILQIPNTLVRPGLACNRGLHSSTSLAQLKLFSWDTLCGVSLSSCQ